MKPQTVPATQEIDAERWLRARIDLVAGIRPVTALLNPIWAALSALPFSGMYPAFGKVPIAVLLGVIAMHLTNAGIAASIHQYWRRNVASPRRLFRILLAFQLLVSTSWGVGACLYWVDGIAANNTFAALLVIAMMWAIALTRSVHPALFAASLLPLTAMFWVRALLGTGEAAQIFALFTPIFAAYAWFLGASAGERVNQIIRSRFENEDLARALEAAKNHALAKSAEAEAASTSKSAFVANMSHELRTPLNAILGFAEIIANDSLGPNATGKYRSYAQDIHDSGAHLLNLINDMLDIAKIEAGHVDLDPQALDAGVLTDATLRLFKPRSQAKQQTVLASVEPSTRLFADERAFRQILVNLVSNAVKFTPEGGLIHVSLGNEASGAARLVVEDSGPGVPPEMIGHLFRPFSQADNRYNRDTGGTGLGLSLVRGLVALHGGKVWLENKANGGLMACVEFPSPENRSRAA